MIRDVNIKSFGIVSKCNQETESRTQMSPL